MRQRQRLLAGLGIPYTYRPRVFRGRNTFPIATPADGMHVAVMATELRPILPFFVQVPSHHAFAAAPRRCDAGRWSARRRHVGVEQ